MVAAELVLKDVLRDRLIAILSQHTPLSHLLQCQWFQLLLETCIPLAYFTGGGPFGHAHLNSNLHFVQEGCYMSANLTLSGRRIGVSYNICSIKIK